MPELSILAKSTIVLAAALLTVRLAGWASASVRALVLASTFAVLIALPVVSLTVPERRVEIPAAYASVAADFLTENFGPAPSTTSPSAVRDGGTFASGFRVPRATTMLRTMWVGGAILFSAPMFISLWRVTRFRRRGRPWADVAASTGRMARQDGVRRPIDVFLHADLAAPMTCGLFRPAIGLPLEAQRWDETALRQALVHELEHVRRMDWQIHVISRLVCAAYWFHPLAWMAWRQLRLESERACDDAVLRNSDRAAYAEQLLSLARRLSRDSSAPLLSMADRSNLARRIAAVLDGTLARGRARSIHAAAVLSAAAALSAVIAPLEAVSPSAPSSLQSATPLADLPRFEVASVKQSASRDGVNANWTTVFEGGRFRATNSTLVRLIQVAYGLRPTDIVLGGPSWVTSRRFDVEAQPEARVSGTQARLMIRSLLAERFNLVLRNESRDTPIYALRVERSDGRLGPQIARPAGECVNPVFALARAASDAPARVPDRSLARPQPAVGQPGRYCGMQLNAGDIKGGSVTMAALSTLLKQWVDRPVVDGTGLDGAFDFELRFAVAARFGRGALPLNDPIGPVPDDSPAVFTALREQLGLKLEPDRGPVDVLVIGSVEPPTEN